MKILVILINIFYFNISFAVTTGEQSSTDTVDQTSDAVDYDMISNRISQSLHELGEDNSDFDCKSSLISDDFKKFAHLWDDLKVVNEKLVNKVFNNFDKFLAYVKHFNNQNDPAMAASAFYMFKAFVDLLVDNEDEKTIIDQDSLKAVWGIFQKEPFNVPDNEGINLLINKIQKLEISKIRRGRYKGEKQLVIHGVDGDDIVIPGEKFLGGQSSDVPGNLEIDDEAKIVFFEKPSDSKGKSRNKKIIKFIKNVDFEESNQLSKKDLEDTIEFIKNKKYNNIEGALPPVYFSASGFEVALKDDVIIDGWDVGNLGFVGNFELDGGVLIPGNIGTEDGQVVNSFFVKGSGTGLISMISYTVAP
jgi:hypothetical protein